MIAQLLETLDVQRRGLLLTLLLFGSREYETLLAHLPDDLSAQLKDMATKIVAFERNKRIQLLVAQLKRLLTFQAQSSLLTIEPSWLADAIKKESPFVASLLLVNLPAQLNRQVAQRLSVELPARENVKPLSAETKSALLKSFERQFAPMPFEEFSPQLQFRHLVLLQAKDLILLTREVGRHQLAAAFGHLGMQNTASFLRHYSQSLQDEIIAGVKEIEGVEAMDEHATKQFLSVVFASFHNAEDLFQKAGLYVVALAVDPSDPLLLRQIAQRFPHAHGQTLIEFAKLLVQNNWVGKDFKNRQMQLLSMLIELSKNKKLDERFSKCTITA